MNIMTIEFDELYEGNKHFNVGRDELLVVLDGVIEITFYNERLEEVRTRVLEACDWERIQANTIHKIRAMDGKAKIIEALGGVFKEGSCIEVGD